MSDQRHRSRPLAAEPGALADAMAEVAQSVAESAAAASSGLDRLRHVPLNVTVELGRARMRIAEVLELGVGSIVELSRFAHEPVDVLVNGTLLARGEVVMIDDVFAVKILEIVQSPPSPS